jgi:hypothetical protein
LKLRKECGIDDIPNEFLRHLPRRSPVHLTHVFNHCFLAPSLPGSLKASKNDNSAETQQRPKISPKLTSDQPLLCRDHMHILLGQQDFYCQLNINISGSNGNDDGKACWRTMGNVLKDL